MTVKSNVLPFTIDPSNKELYDKNLDSKDAYMLVYSRATPGFKSIPTPPTSTLHEVEATTNAIYANVRTRCRALFLPRFRSSTSSLTAIASSSSSSGELLCRTQGKSREAGRGARGGVRRRHGLDSPRSQGPILVARRRLVRQVGQVAQPGADREPSLVVPSQSRRSREARPPQARLREGMDLPAQQVRRWPGAHF